MTDTTSQRELLWRLVKGIRFAMFTTRHQTITNAVVDGDRVAMEVDWTGTPAVDLGPMKAGESIAMRGASFMTIREGLLTRIVDLS